MAKNFTELQNTLLCNHPLADYTSWKIGGQAEYLYLPKNLEDLSQLLHSWQEEPITFLGAATNVLIRDGGIKGLVIYLRNSLNELQELDNHTLRAEAGVRLTHLVQKCADLGLLDAAFMAGIPGTVGGALKMNAGAYGDYIWNYVQAVETIDRQGLVKLRAAKEFQADYRQVSGLAANEWLVAAKFNFTSDSVAKAKELVTTYIKKREQSQPLNLPSCGSVFRNPPGNHAARLIEASGMKGRKIGGAKVSEKHANFIVNCGNATAACVESLIQEVMAAVKKTSGVDLILEVHIIGEK